MELFIKNNPHSNCKGFSIIFLTRFYFHSCQDEETQTTEPLLDKRNDDLSDENDSFLTYDTVDEDLLENQYISLKCIALQNKQANQRNLSFLVSILN
jgi:hypothetical protein